MVLRSNRRGLSDKSTGQREVVFVFRNILHYREEFFVGLRHYLADRGIKLRIIASRPDHPSQGRPDAIWLDWAEPLVTKQIGRRDSALLWQQVYRSTADADLIILEQASRLLVNPVLSFRSSFLSGPRTALWGHGQNPPRGARGQLAEWLKPQFNRGVHWWFAYTQMVRQRLIEQGFPPERITVFQNAYDSRQLSRDLALAKSIPLDERRRRFGAGPGMIAVCISSIYDWKRIDFLIDSVPYIRRRLPDFELIIAGGGPLRSEIVAQAGQVEGVTVLDPITGYDKAELGSIADLTLLGGAVGLSVLDGFIFGTPVIALESDFHGPEIDYLTEADAGVLAPGSSTPEEFAELVVEVMTSEKRAAFTQNSIRAASVYTVETMVERFGSGIVAALA